MRPSCSALASFFQGSTTSDLSVRPPPGRRLHRPHRGAFGQPVPEGRIRYHADNVTVRVPIDDAARADLAAEALTLLTTIPGIKQHTAEVLLAEVGPTVDPFPTAGQFASWAGMCPGNNESAGKRRTGRTDGGTGGCGRRWSRPGGRRRTRRRRTWAPGTGGWPGGAGRSGR